MLAPIAHHERKAQEGKWQEEHESACPGVKLGNVPKENVAGPFREKGLQRQVRLSFPNEI